MAYPLDNLGGYNDVRNDLKGVGGSVDVLYQNIGDAAVDKARPEIFKEGFSWGTLTGIGIGMGIISAIYGGYRYYENKKYEKKARKAELQLQEELTATVEDSSVKSEIEEKPH